ncbi:metabotropic glutamate receptor-like [Amphiura filiformis]|uniref:metabotropic glutamate receptor-like n=1 Tax=Amphiura filiformis TaxID=82378 RepID=UPI003B211D76
MLSEAAISLAFNIMFAPTFLKVTRIFRIFRAGKKSAKRPKFIGPRDQIIMVLVLITLQIVIIILFATLDPAEPVSLISNPPINYIEQYCEFGPGLTVGIIYNFIIITGCCIIALLARKVPSNYNESKFIGISVYSTLIVSLAAVPVYSTADVVLQKVATLCMVLLLNAYLTLICVYIPKLYAIRFVKDDGLNVEDWRSRSLGGSLNNARSNRVIPSLN